MQHKQSKTNSDPHPRLLSASNVLYYQSYAPPTISIKFVELYYTLDPTHFNSHGKVIQTNCYHYGIQLIMNAYKP